MKRRIRKRVIYSFLIFIIILILAVGVSYGVYLTKNKTKLSPKSNEVGLGLASTEPNGYIIELKESLVDEKNYIIEFKEPSLAEKKVELENSLPKTLNRASRYTQIKSALDSQKQKILDEHTNALNDINLKVKAISPTNQIKVRGEYTKVFNGISVNASSEDIEKIKSSPYVKKIYSDVKVKAFLMDSVPLINADDVWQISDSSGNKITGKNIKIAVIDTGVDYTHGDLGGCTQTQFLNKQCSKVIGGYDFVNNDNNPMDDHGHGTHVAATAAGNGILKGVAPDAKIYAYKVLASDGGGYESQIISGIEAAIDPDGDGDFSDHLDIISMSLGGPGNPDDPISKAVDRAVDNGVVAVIAAGNSGPWESSIESPGTSIKAITVGATYKKDYTGSYWRDTNPRVDQITSFSSRGPVIWQDEDGNESAIIKPDVVAPGAIICAAQSSQDTIWQFYIDMYDKDIHCLDNKHIEISGTSMATPHVAGAVALIKQAHPDWTPEDIKTALKGTAIDIGENMATQGHGRVDILKVIKLSEPPEMPWDFYVYSDSPISGIYDKIQINGIFPEEYTSLKVEYRKEGELNWRTNGITIVGSGGVIGEFNPEGNILETGNYTFRTIIVKKDVEKDSEFKIYFDKNILKSWKKLNANILPSLNVYDINNDGKNELVAYSRDGQLYVWNSDGNLLNGWPVFVGTESTGLLHLTSSSPTIGDLDRDGSADIVVGGLDGKVYVINPDGSFKNGWPKYLINRPLSSTPALGDIDNDGNLDIIIASSSYLHVFNYSGDELKGFPVYIPRIGEADFSSSPSIGDIDNDGNLDIIIGANNYNYELNKYEGTVNVIKNDGSNLQGWPFKREVEQAFYSTPAVGNLDNDNLKEISICNRIDRKLYVLNSGGAIRNGWPVSAGCIDGDPAFADLNGDGNLEIFSGGLDFESEWGYVLYVFNGNGRVLPGWPKETPMYSGGAFGKGFIGPIVGDINNDGGKEVIVIEEFPDFSFGSTDSLPKIYVWNSYGNNIDGWPKITYPVKGSPILAKFGEGERMKLIWAARDKIYVFELNTTYNPYTLDWPMFKNDPQHTGCYECNKPLPQCRIDSDCRNVTTTITRCTNSTILYTVTSFPKCISNACTNQTQKTTKTCTYGCSTLETFAPLPQTLSQCNKVVLTCENTYYTTWSSTKCNPADCKIDKYVSCEKSANAKRTSYREKCSKTYSTQCSETAKCNVGDKLISTKPC